LEFKTKNKNKEESRKKMASPQGIAHTVSAATATKGRLAKKGSVAPGSLKF